MLALGVIGNEKMVSENPASTLEKPEGLPKSALKTITTNDSPKVPKTANEGEEMSRPNTPKAEVSYTEYIEKAMEKVKKVPKTCNINLMNSFGMIGPKIAEPMLAGPNVLKYCPKSKYTCCSERHIESTRSYFQAGRKSLEMTIGIIEEILTVFRGRIFKSVFKNLQKETGCHYLLEGLDKIENPEEFFTKKFIMKMINDIQNLANTIPAFLKQELVYFGTLICSICDAHDNFSFVLDQGETTVNAHFDTCNYFIDNIEFSINLAYLVNNFIEPLVQLIKCKRNIADDVKYSISSTSVKSIVVLEKNIEICRMSKDKNIPECTKICNRSLFNYEILRPLTSSNLKSILRTLLLEFAEIDADQFHLEVTGSSIDDPKFDQIQFFNPLDIDFRRFNINKAKWNFDQNGKRILFNTMSSLYFLSEGLGRLLALSLLLFAPILAF
jgi:hypothetical protein